RRSPLPGHRHRVLPLRRLIRFFARARRKIYLTRVILAAPPLPPAATPATGCFARRHGSCSRAGYVPASTAKEVNVVGLLTWIILGAIAGAIAKWIMPGEDPGGIIVTILLGIAGALIGGFIASAIGLGGVEGLTFGSIIIAILGAVLLLFLYRLVTGSRARPRT